MAFIQLNDRNQPYCGCIRSCEQAEKKPFCAQSLKTYNSMCELNKLTCDEGGVDAKHNVVIRHMGKCQCKYHSLLSYRGQGIKTS